MNTVAVKTLKTVMAGATIVGIAASVGAVAAYKTGAITRMSKKISNKIKKKLDAKGKTLKASLYADNEYITSRIEETCEELAKDGSTRFCVTVMGKDTGSKDKAQIKIVPFDNEHADDCAELLNTEKEAAELVFNTIGGNVKINAGGVFFADNLACPFDMECNGFANSIAYRVMLIRYIPGFGIRNVDDLATIVHDLRQVMKSLEAE